MQVVLHICVRKHRNPRVGVWFHAQTGSPYDLKPDIEESIETWMLLEFADKGNLEQAVQQKRFALRGDPGRLDMVRITSYTAD